MWTIYQFTIEAVQVDSRAEKAMKINKIKQACIRLSGRKGDWIMGRFDGYKSILKGFSEELEKLTRMRNDEIASAKSRFNKSALPE